MATPLQREGLLAGLALSLCKPIFVADGRKSTHIGSCSFLCAGSTQYLVTARHVLAQQGSPTFYVATEHGRLYLSGGHYHSKASSLDCDKADLALYPLNAEECQMLRATSFVTIDMIACGNLSAREATVLGYPNSRNNHRYSLPSGFPVDVNIITTRVEEQPDAVYAKYGARRDLNFFVKFRRDSPSANALIKAVGISGGLVLVSDPGHFLWKVAGMPIEICDADGLLLCTSHNAIYLNAQHLTG
jgi:hypothetical protein